MKLKVKDVYEGMLVRDYLKEIHAFSSRLLIAIKYKGGAIIINGQDEKTTYKLQAGDLLQIQFPPERKGALMVPEEMPLSIVAEDEDILVINKAAHMATTPSPHNRSGTVANGILAYYEARNISYTVHAVTRLDRDTTGLLLIAKHRYSHALISKTQQTDGLKRRYQAIVEGHLHVKQGTLKYPIGRKIESIIERTVMPRGKTAITHYRVIAELKEHTLVDIELETGRTHQIRVHFAHIGHPLAGDDLYGGETRAIQRQALHCYELHFPHPSKDQSCLFNAPLPNDMQQLIDRS